EGDEPLGYRAQPLGFGLGGGDLAVLEQRGGQIRQDVPLVGRAAAQAVALGGRGHSDLSLIYGAPWFRGRAASVLLGLHVALVVVAVSAYRATRVESGRRVLERQT